MRIPSTHYLKPDTYVDPADEAGVGECIVGWWDASQLAGFSDGEAVTAAKPWTDLSATGADLGQSSASLQPTYETNELNGMPVINFDGTNDYLIPASTHSELQITGDMTMIMVVRIDDVTQTTGTLFQHGVSGETSATNVLYSLEVNNTAWRTLHENGNGSNNQNSSDAETNISTFWCILVVRRDATAKEYDIQLNSENRNLAYTNNPDGGTSGKLYWGSNVVNTVPFDGAFAEVIICDERMSDVKLRTYIRYLNDKWFPELDSIDFLQGPAALPKSPEDASPGNPPTLWLMPEVGFERWTGSELVRPADTERIDYWRDQSGNAYDFAQDTSSQRPTLVEAGLNGYDTAKFDGFNQNLVSDEGGTDSGAASNATMGDVLNASDWCIFVVAKTNDDAEVGEQYIFNGGGAGDDAVGFGFFIDTDESVRAHQQNTGKELVAEGSTAVEGTFDIYQLRARDGNLYIKVSEGVEYEREQDDITSLAEHLTIGDGGSARLLDGEVAEIICFDVQLSTETRAEIRKYLRDKYAL